MGNRYRDCFVQSGALVEGHFVFTNGAHSGTYVNKDAALVWASHANLFAQAIAGWVLRELYGITAVVGPESGAVPLMADVRTELHRSSTMTCDFVGVRALKVPSGGFTIGKGQARFLEGRRALIVEDIATTGGSAKQAAEAVRAAGGEPVGVSFLWNRGNVTARDLGVSRVYSLVEEDFPTYHEHECPLCQNDVPINLELGHGKAFLERLVR